MVGGELTDLEERSVSVILPALRAGKELSRAVHSMLGQLRESQDELVLVTDGDDELTLSTLKTIKDARIKLVLVEPLSTLPTKLNIGLAQAKGEFIARMDADDIALPWRIARQRAFQRKNGGVVVSTAVVFGSKLRPLPILPQLPITLNHRDFKISLLLTNPAIHPTLFSPKTCIEKVNGYREVPGEDLDLWLRLALEGVPTIRDGLPSILYRYSRSSMSHGQGNLLTKKAVASARPLRAALLSSMCGFEVSETSYEDSLLRFLEENKINWRVRSQLVDFKLNH